MAAWRIRIALAALGVALAAVGAQVQAQAQTYPSKPITILVPAAPGGVTDIVARALGQKLTEAWGQQVVIENKSGANNQIAAETAAKSAPAGLPKDVLTKLNGEIKRIYADPAFQEKFLAPYLYEPMVTSPEEFAAFIQADAAKWREVIKAANVTVE